MDSLLSVLEWDGILVSCGWMWIVCPLMLVIALIMRRSEEKTRRRCGNVLTGFSVPGMFVALVSFGLFVYMFFHLLSIVDPGTHRVDDTRLGKYYYDIVNSPLTLWCLMILILPFQAIASVIAGGIVLNRGSGKAVGTISVVMGLLLITCEIFITVAAVTAMGN